MNIGKQIDSLLRRHAAVYVKGLGVFKRIHTPATFDAKRNIFLPPISFIEFDHFDTQGYDFLTYVQQVEQLEATDAEAKLEAVIASLVDRMNQNGEVVLDSLGTLLSYGNSFVFKPLDLSGFLYSDVKDDYTDEEHQDDLTPDNKQVEAPFIISNEEVIVSSDDDIKPEVIAPPQEEAVYSSPEVVADHGSFNAGTGNNEPQNIGYNEDFDESKGNNSFVYGLIAMLAILILCGIYYFYMTDTPKSLVENNIVFEVPEADSTDVVIDSLDHDAAIDTTLIVIQDTVVHVTNKDEVHKEEEVVNHKYTIVVGTSKTIEDANQQVEAFHKKGHKSVRVLEPKTKNNNKRIIWDTYPTREKRDSAMREVKKHYKSDAWGSEI